MKKGKSIFISHAAKDKVIINDFIDLILQAGLSVPIDEIFCTTIDGTKIESGNEWRDSIKFALQSAKINLLFISPNYKESEVCLNEMGAAWVTSKNVIPLIIKPINYSTVGIIQEPKQIEKLLDGKSLDRIKDMIQEELEIPNKLIKSDRWSAKKNEFILKTETYLESTAFDIPIDREAFNKAIEQKKELENTLKSIIKEKGKLEKIIVELKLAKDKSDVKKIEQKFSDQTDFDKFENLCEKVNQALSEFDPIIIGIIYKAYSGKEITINWEPYREEIDFAHANDYIFEDMDADFETTSEMQKVYKTLNKLYSFLQSDLSEDFYRIYDANYSANLSLNNLKFWQNVIDVKIVI